jgi:hypothetical protein
MCVYVSLFSFSQRQGEEVYKRLQDKVMECELVRAASPLAAMSEGEAKKQALSAAASKQKEAVLKNVALISSKHGAFIEWAKGYKMSAHVQKLWEDL